MPNPSFLDHFMLLNKCKIIFGKKKLPLCFGQHVYSRLVHNFDEFEIALCGNMQQNPRRRSEEHGWIEECKLRSREGNGFFNTDLHNSPLYFCYFVLLKNSNSLFLSYLPFLNNYYLITNKISFKSIHHNAVISKYLSNPLIFSGSMLQYMSRMQCA